MKILLSLLAFILLFALIGVVLVLHYVRRGIRYFRRVARGDIDEEEFQRMSDKYFYRKQNEQQKGPEFDKDYFKGRSTANTTNSRAHTHQHRTVRTDNGVTIIDRRNPDVAQRKIFTHDEGEYVDYTENKE